MKVTLETVLVGESTASLAAMCLYDGAGPVVAFGLSLATLVAYVWLQKHYEAINAKQTHTGDARIEQIVARVSSLEAASNKASFRELHSRG